MLRQVSDYSVYYNNAFAYTKTKLLVNIVEPILQGTILYGEKRDAQLEPYFVPNGPTFQHCPRMI